MKKVEFLIIGQGLAGTMLAFEMLEAGIDFRIVSSPGKSKASLVAAGMINPLVFKRLTKSWMVDELLPKAQSKYRQLEEILGGTFYFEKEILKPLSEQEKELWLKRKQKDEFNDYIGEVMENSPIENLCKATAFASVRKAGYLHLNNFLSAAELHFRERGLMVDAEFLLDENQANLPYGIGDISAEKLVFCEGFHLSNNSVFSFVKLRPVKGEVLQIYAPEISEEYILNKNVFVLPFGNKRFKVGSTFDWKDLSEKTTEAGKISIVERLENLISTNYKIENHWAGVRPTVVDRRPVLGKHPEFKNVFILNGLGTKGVMLAPYFAKEMMSYLSFSNFDLLSEVDVQRFVK